MPHAIVLLKQGDPRLTGAEIGRILGITRSRVSQVLKKYKLSNTCANCYYYVDGFCQCREIVDVVETPNKCQDWSPKNEQPEFRLKIYR